jgi:hypothetical protein
LRLHLEGLIKINNIPMELVRSFKLLGVIIDDNFDFRLHIEMLNSKLAAANSMLLKLRLAGFRRQILLLTLKTLLLSHIHYCTSIWQAAGKQRIKSVQVQLNKGIRIVFGLHRMDSTAFYMTHFNIRSVYQIITINVAKFVFINSQRNSTNQLLYEQFAHFFGGSQLTRSRSEGNLYVPPFDSEMRRRTVFISGVRSYNRLPLAVRSATTIGTFKRRLELARP